MLIDRKPEPLWNRIKKLGSLLPSRSRKSNGERVIRPWRDDTVHAHPSVGLTPSRALALLHAADAGSPQMQFELFGEMLQKWPRLAAVEATRRLALTGLDWEIMPDATGGDHGSASDDARRAADYCREVLGSFERFTEALDHLAGAIGFGIGVAELVWENGSLIDVVPAPYSRLVADANEPWRLRVRTEEDPSVGAALDDTPHKWIIHKPRALPGRPFEGGLLRASVLLYLAQNLSFKDWLIYSQIAKVPVRVGRFEPGTPESDKQKLLKMLESLGSDAVAIMSKNVELQLLETRGGDKPYQPLQEYCNNEITILWLGQHLTTDIRGQGSRAAAEIHGVPDGGFRVRGSGWGGRFARRCATAAPALSAAEGSAVLGNGTARYVVARVLLYAVQEEAQLL